MITAAHVKISNLETRHANELFANGETTSSFILHILMLFFTGLSLLTTNINIILKVKSICTT
jgi:hypothetical protein